MEFNEIQDDLSVSEEEHQVDVNTATPAQSPLGMLKSYCDQPELSTTFSIFNCSIIIY